jgi:TonB family protein
MRALLVAAGLLLSACASSSSFGPIPAAPTAEELAAAQQRAVAESAGGMPVWITRPDGQDYVRAYPPRALSAGIPGRVTMDCILQADGSLRCAPRDDGEPEHNFEHAALLLSTLFRMAPEDSAGVPVAGRPYELTIRFVTRR